jgi:signal transduction histidine kinase
MVNIQSTGQEPDSILECISGMAEVRADGKVLFISDSFYDLFGKFCKKEMPLNLYDYFGSSLDAVYAAIKGLSTITGSVVSFGFDCRVEVVSGDPLRTRRLMCTLTRTHTESVIITIFDFTDFSRLKMNLETTTRMLEFREAWLEVTRGLMHDIGNAISGVSLLAAQMNGEEEWEESDSLTKLKLYLESYASEMERVLGPGKYEALSTLLNALLDTWANRKRTLTEKLNTVIHSVAHIGELIYLHRNYSCGPDDGEREPLDLMQIVRDSLLILRSQLERRNIRIDIENKLVGFVVRGNRARLMSVFLNLIKNAYESLEMSQGETAARKIGFMLSCPTDEVVSVQVSDNGGGFTPAQGEMIFEKNFSTKMRSSGFGLYSCRNIIRDHGGKIWMVSNGTGLGATVFIELPQLKRIIHAPHHLNG